MYLLNTCWVPFFITWINDCSDEIHPVRVEIIVWPILLVGLMKGKCYSGEESQFPRTAATATDCLDHNSHHALTECPRIRVSNLLLIIKLAKWFQTSVIQHQHVLVVLQPWPLWNCHLWSTVKQSYSNSIDYHFNLHPQNQRMWYYSPDPYEIVIFGQLWTIWYKIIYLSLYKKMWSYSPDPFEIVIFGQLWSN